MVALPWHNGKVHCPHRGSTNRAGFPMLARSSVTRSTTVQEFSLKLGAIFEDSPIALEKWLPVMWMLVNGKNSVSSWEIHRAIGVTRKTARFILRARLAMQDPLTGGKLSGEVEVDRSFIGGKARNMHPDANARKIQGRRGPMGKLSLPQSLSVAEE